ncbi:helix-turn-helix domain-containing protein [Streptosporangium saharense]|uniref:helix-turn-helix domain-containing protein n=1 Tax=Streptosporangium saharense TaxID=1706840 RepID=UPI0035E41D25
MRSWIDLGTAGERAAVSRSTVNRWIAAGRLRCVEVGGHRFVNVRELLEVERERRASRGRKGPRVPLKLHG